MLHYDTQKPLAEGTFGKAYEGRGLSVRVNIVSDPGVKKVCQYLVYPTKNRINLRL